MRKNSLARYFTIGGFVAGEVYMVFVTLAPNLKGETVPWEVAIQRILGSSLFFGPFGAAIGLGIWMLGEALRQTFYGVPPPDEPEAENASGEEDPPVGSPPPRGH